MDRLEVVRVLLDYGVDVEGQDEVGGNRIIFAIDTYPICEYVYLVYPCGIQKGGTSYGLPN